MAPDSLFDEVPAAGPGAPAAPPVPQRAGGAAPGDARPTAPEAAEDLWLTNRVLAQLAPARDRPELLRRLAVLMDELVPHHASLIATVEGRDPLSLQVAVAHGLNGAVARLPPRFASAQLIDPWALEEGPLHVPDLGDTPLQVADLFSAQGMRSLLSIPLAATADGSAEAVLILAHREVAAFATVRAGSLVQLQRAIAVPLANALQAMQERAGTASLLASTTRVWAALGPGLDSRQALGDLLGEALGAAKADAGTFMAIVPENQALYVRASYGMRTRRGADAQLPWGSRAAGPVATMAGPYWVRHLGTPGSPAIGVAGAEGFHTYAGLPVRAVDGPAPAGLLNLYWRSDAPELTSEQLLLLTHATRAMAAVVERQGLAAREAACARVIAQFHAHKTRMFSLIGHQLRTPMTSIGGYAQLMVRRAPDATSATARYATTILQESRRMGALIDNVLELSRLEDTVIALESRPFDLHALLEDMRGEDALRARVAGRLHWQLPDELPIAVGDPLGLKQALLALVRRALLRLPGAAIPLVAAVRDHEEPRRVEITLGRADPQRLVANSEDLLDLIDLRHAVDSQQARDDELALYSALQLLHAMGADFRIEMGAQGEAAYVIGLPVWDEP